MPLSQVIVTSRYLKSGSARSVTKRKNYTKYIATRETVEKREQNQYNPNYYEYMDIDENGVIDETDYAWFSNKGQRSISEKQSENLCRWNALRHRYFVN